MAGGQLTGAEFGGRNVASSADFGPRGGPMDDPLQGRSSQKSSDDWHTAAIGQRARVPADTAEVRTDLRKTREPQSDGAGRGDRSAGRAAVAAGCSAAVVDQLEIDEEEADRVAWAVIELHVDGRR